MGINFIKHSLSFLIDFSLFMILHIFINFILGSYLWAFLISITIYVIFLLIIRKELILILPVFMAFFIFTLSVPVMNDRSGTVFIMKTIDQIPGISKKELSRKLTNEYIKDEFFLEKRLNEGIMAGNIEEKNDKLFPTQKGYFFVNIYNIFNKIYPQ